MIYVYSHKVYVMPTKTTWEQHDVKYNTNVKSELDNLLGDANLLPCYDFEKQYYYMPSSSTNSYILMAQNYADNIDESGYYAAISQDLIDLGYVLNSSRYILIKINLQLALMQAIDIAQLQLNFYSRFSLLK